MKINKLNKKAGENTALNKILNFIIIILVLGIVIFSIIYLKLPEKLKDLFPDWGNPNPLDNQSNTLIIQKQEETPFKEKSLSCPSPYKNIYLKYSGGKRDIFRVRFNKKLGQPQIIPILNGNYYSITEWLISPNLLNFFKETKKIFAEEKNQIEYIMEAETQKNLVERIVEISQLSKNYWKIYYNPDNENFYFDDSNKENMVERILEELNNPELQIEYEKQLVYAVKECRDDTYLKSINDAIPKWTIESAIVTLRKRDPNSKYSKNAGFIDELFLSHLLTSEEYKEISGVGLFNKQEKIKYVSNLLEKNLIRWQTETGGKILEIIKNKYNYINNEEIKTETNSNSFACLILQQASVESNIKHCIYNANYLDNPIYCSSTQNIHRVLKSGGDEESYGVMQINTDVHEEVDVVNFQENVEFGIDYLIRHYNSKSLLYPEGKDYCGKKYIGWELALRYYNGWGAPNNCNSGNPNYVEDIKNKKTEILNLFPKCKSY